MKGGHLCRYLSILYIHSLKTAWMKFRLFSASLALFLFLACKKNGSSYKPPVVTNQTPEITGFQPNTGAPGILVEIRGQHFDTSANNLLVEFNGTQATIYSTDDSVMYVYVPAGVTTGKISVNRAGLTGTSDSIFTALSGGHWVQKNGIPGPDSANGRFVGIGFSVGNKGYMGLGIGNDGTTYSDLFQYDPVANAWTQEASCPLPFAGAICMVINNIAYIGLGQTQIAANSNSLFAYDPGTNTWTRKSDFPGPGQSLVLGVAMGNIGLVGLGANTDGIQMPEVWTYDPATDSWTQKANFSGIIIPSWLVGFSLDGKTAMVAGTDYSGSGHLVNVVYQYDPVADTWTPKQSRPGNPMVQASTMIIKGNGYIMGGGQENWMYQSSSDSWTQVPFFTERTGAASFVIDSTGYFGNGSGLPQIPLTDLWQFTP
jgi:N-acetylneuraminic acid mutarotase